MRCLSFLSSVISNNVPPVSGSYLHSEKHLALDVINMLNARLDVYLVTVYTYPGLSAIIKSVHLYTWLTILSLTADELE